MPRIKRIKSLWPPGLGLGGKKIQPHVQGITRYAPTHPWTNVPSSFQGPSSEYAIYYAHMRLGLQEGVNFSYQSPLGGGRSYIGGTVIDFLEHDVNIAIRVQGRYYHLDRNGGGDTRARDQIQKSMIESRGYPVVDIYDDNALKNPVGMLVDARRGIEHP